MCSLLPVPLTHIVLFFFPLCPSPLKSFSVAFVGPLAAAHFTHADNMTISRGGLSAEHTPRFIYLTHYSKESLEEPIWGFPAPKSLRFGIKTEEV